MKPASEANIERGHPSLEYHIKDVGHYSGAAGTITVFRSKEYCAYGNENTKYSCSICSPTVQGPGVAAPAPDSFTQ